MRTDVKNTLMYQRLQSAIGRKNLENIIANDNIITANGQIRHYNDDIEVKKTTLRYHNIGLKEFYDNYEEILEYFKTKRKDKVALIDQLIQDKAIVWTSKYPVYSSALRPEGINVESYFFSPLNHISDGGKLPELREPLAVSSHRDCIVICNAAVHVMVYEW